MKLPHQVTFVFLPLILCAASTPLEADEWFLESGVPECHDRTDELLTEPLQERFKSILSTDLGYGYQGDYFINKRFVISDCGTFFTVVIMEKGLSNSIVDSAPPIIFFFKNQFSRPFEYRYEIFIYG